MPSMIYKGITYSGTPAELAEITRRIRVNEEMANAPPPTMPLDVRQDVQLLKLLSDGHREWGRR